MSRRWRVESRRRNIDDECGRQQTLEWLRF